MREKSRSREGLGIGSIQVSHDAGRAFYRGVSLSSYHLGTQVQVPERRASASVPPVSPLIGHVPFSDSCSQEIQTSWLGESQVSMLGAGCEAYSARKLESKMGGGESGFLGKY